MRFFGRPISSARCGRQQRRLHHGLARHVAGVDRMVRLGVLVHQVREQFLVERAPIGADAHRLVVLDRGLDDGAELAVLLFLEADIAGIDAVLVERLGAGRVIGQELVADIVEVADDRHVDVHFQEPLLDVRHGGRGLVAVDGDAHDFGAGPRQRRHLLRRPVDVGGVGIGHRLHHDGRAAADGDVADLDGDGLVPLGGTGKFHHRSSPLTLMLWPLARAGNGARTAAYSLTAAGLRGPSRPPPAATARRKAGVSGSFNTRWPAATPKSGVRKVNTDSRAAE